MSQHEALFAQDLFYLTKVSYNEPKAEVLVEFSNESTRFVQRHRFFPYISFAGIEQGKLSDLVLSLGFKGFSIEKQNGLLLLRALSFSLLKKISTALALHINKKPLALEPERAFLIEKKWSFFDSFEKIGDLLFKAEVLGEGSQGLLRKKDLGFFLTREIPFSEALKVSEEDALFLVEKAAWSSILSVPIASVPKELGEKIELFLENIFFRHGEMLSFEKAERVFLQKDYDPFSRDSTSRVDFSLVWAELFSNNFFNIGPETRNCPCCLPVALESKNLLPSSLIKVRFNEDNFFFESSSESFALDFHNENPFKDQRLGKRREFFLNSFPVGPFFSGDFALIPLMDAKRLIGGEKAQLVSGASGADASSDVQKAHELNWFCLNRESFFSKEVRGANALLFGARTLVDSFESSLIQGSFAYFYYKAFFRALTAALSELPLQLTNPNSKFFSTQLAKSIVSIQEATVAKFREFSEKEGYRVLHAGKSFASIKGFSSLKLAKDFAKQTNLPQPQIVGFSVKNRKRF